MKTAKDYLCMAFSPEGFICNREPNHEGDHVATARGRGDHDGFEADRWPNATPAERSEAPSPAVPPASPRTE
jgi:hypothetical protein